MAELAVELRRGDRVESWLAAEVAVVDSAGQLRWWLGNPGRESYWRSGAKPLQALALLESQAAAAAGLSGEELALACASHAGGAEEVAAVAQWLRRLDLDPRLLVCGSAGDAPPERRLAHNCSGKHAGMLTVARHLGASLADYWRPDHPVQARIQRLVATVAGVGGARLPTATDGCGVPTFYLSVARMALAYARLGDPRGLPDELVAGLNAVAAAMAAYPERLAGPDAWEARLFARTAGAALGKRGAEGVACVALPRLGLGVAVKVTAGSGRGVEPIVGQVLRALEVEDRQGLAFEDWVRTPLINTAGMAVGEIRAFFRLRPARA